MTSPDSYYNLKRVEVSEDDWSKIQEEFEYACCMPLTPDESFRKVKMNDIIDETQSVIWNKNEVQRLQQEYTNEVFRLRQARNHAISIATERAIHMIAKETGLSPEKAKILWSFIYDRHHAYMSDLFNQIDEYTNLVKDLLA